jgi:hypothetical protein
MDLAGSSAGNGNKVGGEVGVSDGDKLGKGRIDGVLDGITLAVVLEEAVGAYGNEVATWVWQAARRLIVRIKTRMEVGITSDP